MVRASEWRGGGGVGNIDQRGTAGLTGVSVPTIQRMEASDGVIRGNVDSLMKLISALERAGIELINEGSSSPAGGRGVRLKEQVQPKKFHEPQRKPSPRAAPGRAR